MDRDASIKLEELVDILKTGKELSSVLFLAPFISRKSKRLKFLTSPKQLKSLKF